MSHKKTRRHITAVGTATGVLLAAGLSPLDTTPVAHASSPWVDTVLTSNTDNFDVFTQPAAADNVLADISPNAFPGVPDIGVPDIVTPGSEPLDSVADTGFISNMTDLGLFNITTAANPDEDFIAFVFQMPLLGVTDILTSGADPADNLGLGEAGIGLAGSTVNTLLTPLFDSTFTLPFEDPFADLFTLLVQLGF